MKQFVMMSSMFLAFATNAMDLKHEMGVASFDSIPEKVVALDWALTEAVLSLGVELEGVADIDGYKQWVVEPVLNSNATNVGSRREPNLELLTTLKPDVILISKHMAAAYERLNQIAPVVVFSVYSEDKQPLESAESVTVSLGKLFGKERQAKKVIQQTKRVLAENGAKVRAANKGSKPFIFARFINDKTLRVHGQGSLAQSTLDAMGLRNDWQAQTNLWGFSTVGTEKLAEHQHTNVMLLGPLKEQELIQLSRSPLWQVMEFTRTDSVHELPAIWTFGGLIAAQRFSFHISDSMNKQ
ncbi:MAG: iron-siderophore ABC transporter substrate-binding protein [Vibrio toranzoniae]|uniref:iron-siderophore ABC transporter substrate-binding protein n=1 Tax=Vibrio toranzoniae TaxID=1194427 RepID=UPI003F9B8B9B